MMHVYILLALAVLGAAGEKLDTCILHPKIEERVVKDTAAWGDAGITEDLVKSISKHCDTEARIRLHYCNCQPQRILIENGTVYLNNLIPRHRLGPHEHIGLLVELYEASQVYRLPNVEFTYWLDDHPPGETNYVFSGAGPHGAPRATAWPYEPAGGLPPMVAWSKSADNGVLMVPYSGAFRCAKDSFDALEASLPELAGVAWADKLPVGFGRWNGFCTYYYGMGLVRTADGQPVPCPRIYLNNVSAAHPDLLSAFDLGVAKPVPLAHQNRYKYIVSTDGWSISSKFDKYLLLGSTVFKAASIRDGFYYDALEPNVHFIPFMVKHKDDIVDAIQWARQHDDEARRMAEAAREFARQHLSRPARLCYLFRLLTHLSKQYRYPVSCSRRKLCVPLAQELRYYAQEEKTRDTCPYGEVFDRYGGGDPLVAPDAGRLAEISAMHVDPLHWPRDDL
ncbi:hypothetical protein HXX76_013996 [Chlamydomonas incerta]|uniref:Glycosyl transferase CAP10 domain-containing protein n=1 Tax=Chlamydomonas incerta TaxID=51695 RepID=A0A835SHQ0_CHLIN|nr:hypothetical protein HXX76_013996 [Chlamydomonas incerta]|eukprot:KAG2425087.1 hypothetical protein HXX76_013996 [Chlamydomonas incerta]